MGKWEGGKGKAEADRPGMIRRFEELTVWQTARELAKGVYRASTVERLKTDYAMISQMKRAVIGISSNIAEGYERGTRKQQIEFCYIAKGSAGELRSQVLIARDVGLLSEEAFTWLIDACEKCSRQLSAYVRHLQRTSNQIRGLKYTEVG